MQRSVEGPAGPGHAAKLFAALVIGGLAGAGGVYSWMRPPAPAVVRAPVPEPAPVQTQQVHRIEKKWAEAPEPEPQPAAETQVPAAVEPQRVRKAKEASVGGIARKVNINAANAAELELLPEVGPKLASEIVKYRETHGGFKSVLELDNVKGVGEKTLAKLAPLVTVGDELP
ncbi:MAG: ComEA family DNA-binding protein [Phycisphaerales bacterium]